MSGSKYERELKHRLASRTRPWLVVRAGGSLGCDLAVMRGDISFPVEVKSSASKRVPFSSNSGRAQAQAEEYIEDCARAKLVPVYAFRLKRERSQDPWRVFGMATRGCMPAIKGVDLPCVEKTAQGNYQLDWEKGMPLTTFLDKLDGGSA